MARTATTTAAKTAARTPAKSDTPFFYCTRFSSWIINTEAITPKIRLQCQMSGRSLLRAGTSAGARFSTFLARNGRDSLGLFGGVFGGAEGADEKLYTFGRGQQDRALRSFKRRTVCSVIGSTTALDFQRTPHHRSRCRYSRPLILLHDQSVAACSTRLLWSATPQS